MPPAQLQFDFGLFEALKRIKREVSEMITKQKRSAAEDCQENWQRENLKRYRKQIERQTSKTIHESAHRLCERVSSLWLLRHPLRHVFPVRRDIDT